MIITGVDVHPGFAKNKLVNALRLACRVVAELRPTGSPPR